MKKTTIAQTLLLSAAAALVFGQLATATDSEKPHYVAVPRAQCSAGDSPEAGLQGQTTLAERFDGTAEKVHNCNLALVGQLQGEGASWQMAVIDKCAYYATGHQQTQQHPGVVVVDVSDPAHPKAVGYLTAVSMLDPWESLKINVKRKLLAATEASDGKGGRGFAVYDVSDCTHPKLLSSVVLNIDVHGHAGDFSPDGMTYYAAEFTQSVYSIDVSDPTHPRVLNYFKPKDDVGLAHDIRVGADGRLAYFSQPGLGGLAWRDFSSRKLDSNGLAIVDVSDIQNRTRDGKMKVIGTLFWNDGTVAQDALPIRIAGHPYVVVTDEFGAGFNGNDTSGRRAACGQMLPPSGFARIIDVAEPTRPKLASRLMLEVHEPSNCSRVLDDSNDLVTYDAHYCAADVVDNTRLLACSYFESGLRIFDVRDPLHPREFAYYKPQARPNETLPGAWMKKYPEILSGRADITTSTPHWEHQGNDTFIWFTSHEGGFQVLRLEATVQSTGHP